MAVDVEVHTKMTENTKYKDGVNRNARLIVRNVSFKATEEVLREHFSQYGTIEEVKLLKRPDGKLVGCGFVHFTNVPMANEALRATNKKPFLGRPLAVAWAVSKDQYANKNNSGTKSSNNATSDKPKPYVTEDSVDIKPLKEEKNKMRVNRNARLIVRNVSFKATEQSLKEHFEPYGEVLEVNLLKKPDGKLVGCAFVLFKNVPMAKKALLSTNMKPFLARPISVDWAVAKNKYMQHAVNQELELRENVKKEEADSEDDGHSLNTSNEAPKEEIKSESDEADVKSEDDDDASSSDSNDSDDEASENDASDDEDDDDLGEEEQDEEVDNQSVQSDWKRVKLNDAEDGCTVFLTNMPFMIDNDLLKDFAQQTGPVKYALVCMDKMTEHSKGTGFVKFVNKEDADKFLSLPADQLRLEGQVVQVKPALKRENVQKAEKKEAKDNRHLYLVKEGVVVAGTKAAVGVSASDMTKRLTLERSKTQMLKNLNRFVSRYRLVVSNLPANYDDAALRRVCVDTVGRNATVTECRVMRDLRAPALSDSRQPSKGYGFVMFTKHEDALACLRKLNNNPDVFDRNNRPIVSFSIEDRTALNARKKRLEKSIANNPQMNRGENNNPRNRNRKRRLDMPPDESYVNKKGRFDNKNLQNKKAQEVGKFVRRPTEEDFGEYTGLTAKEGAQHTMRTNHKLKSQADLHKQNVKMEKKNSQRSWRLKMAAKERVKQPKQRINKDKSGGKRRRFKRNKSAL